MSHAHTDTYFGGGPAVEKCVSLDFLSFVFLFYEWLYLFKTTYFLMHSRAYTKCNFQIS